MSVKMKVNGREVEVPSDANVLQACELSGEEIPRFCYHEGLSVAGNCRMCLVEVSGSPKLAASCATRVSEGMEALTDTARVREARRGMLEFLLINHPLDCPICDQGGECDLQDQAAAYGAGRSMFGGSKRAVEGKSMGPLIKTEMTRCIHCTRCVRFAAEVGGVEEMGAFGRGEDMEIGTYLGGSVGSELSGNMIDLCPVGALTSGPYAFSARSWELRETDTVDVMDAVGDLVSVGSRGREVMRVLPRGGGRRPWISDRARFIWDALGAQRLDRPYVREGKASGGGRLREASWGEALGAAARGLSEAKGVGALSGGLTCGEGIAALKEVMGGLGSSHMDCREEGARFPLGSRGNWVFNSGYGGIEEADAVLFVGCNMRMEAPTLNARFRKRWRDTGLPAGMIGASYDATWPVEVLGSGPATLKGLVDGHGRFCQRLVRAKRPLVVLGQGALIRDDGEGIFDAAWRLAREIGAWTEEWRGFSVLQYAAGRVGALDLGFIPGKGGWDRGEMLSAAGKGKLGAMVLYGADEVPMDDLGEAFVVYVGSHGDAGAQRADVILPSAAWTEQEGRWVNAEGRVRVGGKATPPPGEAREDWRVFRALAEELGQESRYDDVEGLLELMKEKAPWFGGGGSEISEPESKEWKGDLREDEAFCYALDDFYLPNVLGRSSRTMLRCSRELGGRKGDSL